MEWKEFWLKVNYEWMRDGLLSWTIKILWKLTPELIQVLSEQTQDVMMSMSWNLENAISTLENSWLSFSWEIQDTDIPWKKISIEWIFYEDFLGFIKIFLLKRWEEGHADILYILSRDENIQDVAGKYKWIWAVLWPNLKWLSLWEICNTEDTWIPGWNASVEINI